MLKILDLFCGEGGAAMGYYRAASKVLAEKDIQIVGVDIRRMVKYPFGFVHSDVLRLDYDFLLSFDFIHASPPCKAYTQLSHFSRYDTDESILPRLLTTLEAAAKPYVVENVPQAPIRADIQLDGSMFGLDVKRRRIFQTNLRSVRYPQKTTYSLEQDVVTVAGNSATLTSMRKAMKINWMSKAAITQSIPPVYTEWIFDQVLNQILLTGF